MAENCNKRLNWDELYMGIALITSQRSPDIKMKVGVCIVAEDGKVLGIGSNSSPYRSEWPDKDQEKHDTVVHAELNAIIHSTGCKNGATIYTTLHPCWQCAKAIVQTGIRRVVYLQVKDGENYKVAVAKKILRKKKIILESFHEISRDNEREISFCFEKIPSTGAPYKNKFMLNFVPWDFNKQDDEKL